MTTTPAGGITAEAGIDLAMLAQAMSQAVDQAGEEEATSASAP